MGLMSRLGLSPERATGTREQQAMERFRAAECRVERAALREVLVDLLSIWETAGPATDKSQAIKSGRTVVAWCDRREEARQVGQP